MTWEPPKATLDATERFTFTCCNDERSLIPFDPGRGPGVDLAREESKGWVGYRPRTHRHRHRHPGHTLVSIEHEPLKDAVG